ncbi:MAG: spore cortex biosynthesis protein YabQ [Coprococcus comes]
MSGIGTEIRVFCYAILTGVLIVAVYLWIRVLRRLVAHRLWLINLEDACYWAGISVYTFAQIYIRVMVFCGGISDWGLRSDQSGWRCFQLSL